MARSYAGLGVAPSPAAPQCDRASQWCAARRDTGRQWWRGTNRNVKLAYAVAFGDALVKTQLAGQVLGVWVLESASLGNGSNGVVGLTAAAAGISQALTAPLAGWLCDRHPRELVLRVAAMLGVASIIAMLAAFATTDLAALYVSLAAWGIYSGAQMTAVEVTFADSLATGASRSDAYGSKYAVENLGRGTGPLLSLLYFAFVGDEWDLSHLQALLIASACVALAPVVLLCRFRDRDTLGASSEAFGVMEAEAQASDATAQIATGGRLGRKAMPQLPTNPQDDSEEATAGEVAMGGRIRTTDDDDDESGATTAPKAPAAGSTTSAAPSGPSSDPDPESRDVPLDESGGPVDETPRRGRTYTLPCGGPTLSSAKHIPYIIIVSDIITMWGAGQTAYYFGLWFKTEFDMSPEAVLAVFVVSPPLVAAASLLATHLGKAHGRAQVALWCNSLGIACLVFLPLCPAIIAVPLFLGRTALMNASTPLQRAILMDWVSKKNRGKWSAVESLTNLTWTGSAAVGGLMVDRHGYGFTFEITAGLYVVGSLVLALLLPLASDGDSPGGDVAAADEPSETVALTGRQGDGLAHGDGARACVGGGGGFGDGEIETTDADIALVRFGREVGEHDGRNVAEPAAMTEAMP